MIRLILKIFLAYWIAAGVVIAIGNLEPHRQIHHPELVDALDTSLLMNGRLIIDAYESDRCSQLQHLLMVTPDALSVVTPDAHLLCGDVHVPNDEALVQASAKSGTRMTTNHMFFQLIAMPMRSESGKNYVILLKSSYQSALQIDGLLPGYTTIAVSCVVTVFLAFLVALPIRRLRTAAREIATGNLDARVLWGKMSEKIYGFKGRDDIAKLVQDFNHMAERLQALAESQRLLLRDVSHELRSPLTRLGVGLGLARQEAPATMRQHLDRIESEAQRLNDLIGQILSLSYLETIREIELPRDVSLSELVVDLLPDVQYEAAQSSCTIKTTIGLGCNVRGDADLLRSAVENIVRNAIRYVPDNGLIHVEAMPVEKDGKVLSVVRISDNGPGIPEGELKCVLEPFYRADKSRYWQQSGFGIGLAIANRAARVHGGTIHIRNRLEGGLTVEMCFPSAV
jgi:two-component system, OmpR family, sensor histidine kinase CpxA